MASVPGGQPPGPRQLRRLRDGVTGAAQDLLQEDRGLEATAVV